MTTSFPQPALIALCDDNDRCLESLAALVRRLTDADYVCPVQPCDAGIGSHVRHVLDHYDALLNGIDAGRVDYDSRERDPATECDRRVALARIDSLRVDVAALAQRAGDAPLRVCLDCGTGGRMPAASTLSRELQFLVSHTVHHDALIAAAARALGVETEHGFGIAPSTLKANASRQACANRPLNFSGDKLPIRANGFALGSGLKEDLFATGLASRLPRRLALFLGL